MKINFILVFFMISYNSMASTSYSETECGGDFFSKDCKTCLIQNSPFKLGEGNTSLTWDMTAPRSRKVYIYLDENKDPVHLEPFYKNGEVTVGKGGFHWNDEIKFKDAQGAVYLEIPRGSTKNLFSTDKGFFVKFQKLSDDVKKNGTMLSEVIEKKGSFKPLFEISYTIKYYLEPDTVGDKLVDGGESKDCMLAYPIW